MNFIGNAIKFTNKGSISIHVSLNKDYLSSSEFSNYSLSQI